MSKPTKSATGLIRAAVQLALMANGNDSIQEMLFAFSNAVENDLIEPAESLDDGVKAINAQVARFKAEFGS